MGYLSPNEYESVRQTLALAAWLCLMPTLLPGHYAKNFRSGDYENDGVEKLMEDVFIHPYAVVEDGAVIGYGSRIWAFSHILPGATIGQDCNICDHTFIESGVTLGDRVTVKCGVFLWDGITAEDDVHIGPCATFTNDMLPRSKQAYDVLRTQLKTGCSIGANATILPGIMIREYALIAAGSVVTRSVPRYAMMKGNPAKQHGWVCKCAKRLEISVDGIAHCCNHQYQLRDGVLEICNAN